MLNISNIVKYISNNWEITNFDYSYYSLIDLWLNWYRGEVESFHNYTFYNGIDSIDCERSKMHMAKQICADIASMALNENVIIGISDEKSNKFIQGFDQSGGIFGENNFWENATQLYEMTCALGTSAFEVYLNNMSVISGTTKIVPSTDTKIKIGFIRADHILPISFENKIITEVCFMNEVTINNEDYIDLRLHLKNEKGLYVIYNRRLKTDNKGNIADTLLDNNLVESFETGSSIPMFSILKTAFANNFDLIGNNPLGISVYANAIDILKGCDIAYDTLAIEMKLGQKFVFLNKNMMDLDENGHIRTPYDVRQSLFQFIGDTATAPDQNWVHEVSPTLRIDELTKALEKQLDYLSAKVGLGDHFYKFTDDGGTKTATEVLAENSSAYRHVRRAQISIEQALINLVKSILYCGKTFLGLDVDIDTDISIQFDASIIENKDTIRQRDLEEVDLGIMSKEEYRAKYHAESIESATDNIKKIRGDKNDIY